MINTYNIVKGDLQWLIEPDYKRCLLREAGKNSWRGTKKMSHNQGSVYF
jgi:hypothetical protein